MTKAMFLNHAPFLPHLETRVSASTGPNLRPKFLPPDVQSKIYKERATLYDDIRQKTPRREKVDVECSVILISACQDNQVAMDGTNNGLFTDTLLKVSDNGRFTGVYPHFRTETAPFPPPPPPPTHT